MSKIEGIERLEGRGITAKVTDSGNQFTIYNAFSEEIGYPDATETFTKGGYGKRERLADIIDETFAVLARGKHERRPYGYVYVLESSDGERFLVSEHGLDITYPTTQDSTRLDQMDYGELIEYADEVNRAVRRKAYAEGYEQGKIDQRMETEVDGIAKVTDNVGVNNEETAQESAWSDNVNPPTMDELMALGKKVLSESPQEKRDRVVAQAKADVSELFLDGHHGVGKVVYSSDSGHNTVEYIVNAKKKTVVALLRGAYVEGLIYRGIAKCAPDDCFNAHIGKVIALYRALGKDVPSEYLRVPNPTEVRVGNIVRGANGGDHFYHREKTFTITQTAEGHDTYGYAEDGSDWLNKGDVGKIVDDSESRTQ